MNTHHLICLVSLFGNISLSFAQIKTIREKSLVTGKEVTISIRGEYKDMAKTVERYRPIIIFKRESGTLMLGNPCAERVMRRYRFTYELVPQNLNMSPFRYFFHNFWAKTRLMFKNGPFWKGKMRRKIEKCRELTGDFVGFVVTCEGDLAQ